MAVKDKYTYYSGNIPVIITIEDNKEEFTLTYNIAIAAISDSTEVLLNKIRDELITKSGIRLDEVIDTKRSESIKSKFKDTINYLLSRYLPDIGEKTKDFLITYLMHKSLGLGKIELLLDDIYLEDIVVNNSSEPIWVYHHKHGWLKTNIKIESEDQIKHYSALIGRKVGRNITLLTPLLDAHLETGERINATLNPISTKGNTITLRKFNVKPITITNMLQEKTISLSAAALLWIGVEYELSALVAGGTASGKTTFLNALCGFFPPNQRIISIEDTRELILPKYLHWIPMNTREPNIEGKGEISMLDLTINSLRMRPDRIVVGEIRRQREAETLFEAMHTGHSVYATLHANDTEETLNRLLTPPISVPRSSLPAISMIIIAYRNRRTGIRRIFQISEVKKDANAKVLMQYDLRKDSMFTINKSERLMPELQTQTGFTAQEINQDLREKSIILSWLAKKKIDSVDDIGKIIATYYRDKTRVLELIKK